MTSIKLSAVCMGYRCGWASEDKNQTRILAIDLDRHFFDQLLCDAVLAHEEKKTAEDSAASEVIVQWDPERVFELSSTRREAYTRPLAALRSLQLGLRGSAAVAYATRSIVKITDVTSAFRSIGAHLAVGDLKGAKQILPVETVYPLPAGCTVTGPEARIGSPSAIVRGVQEVVVDCSILEGGGQIIRTTLGLAWLLFSRGGERITEGRQSKLRVVHATPAMLGPTVAMPSPCCLRLTKIRAGRSTPGLAAQHLESVHLAAILGGLSVHGAILKSTELTVHAARVWHSCNDLCVEARVKGAGSTMLMLQAALPPLIFCAPIGTHLVLRGGTDAAFAPPVDHTRLVLVPLLRLFGVQLSLHLVSRGFFPRGGGEVHVNACVAQLQETYHGIMNTKHGCNSSAGSARESPITLSPVDMLDRGTPTIVRASIACEIGAEADAHALWLALRPRLARAAGLLVDAVELTVEVADPWAARESAPLRTQSAGGDEYGARGAPGTARAHTGASQTGGPDASRRREISTQIAVHTSTSCVLSVNHLGPLSDAPLLPGGGVRHNAVGYCKRETDNHYTDCVDTRAAPAQPTPTQPVPTQPAEACAEKLCRKLTSLLASGACADEHTVDQLVIFMALAKGRSRLLAPPRSMLSTLHLETVAAVAAEMTGAKILIREAVDAKMPVAVEAGAIAEDDKCSHPCLLVECHGIGRPLS